MARTQDLPLYSSAYSFTREIYKIKVKLPRVLNHDLGQEAFLSSYKILKCVALANKSIEKARHISRLLLEVQVQWVSLRLLYDLHGISEGEFKVLSERLSEIEKQGHAWLKWENGQALKRSSLRTGVKNAGEEAKNGLN